jgi:NTE family protein
MRVLPRDCDVDLVFSGAGTLFPTHIGAYAALRTLGVKPVRVGGTSGGAIVAAGVALGRHPLDLLHATQEAFADGLLAPAFPPKRLGLFSNRRIYAHLEKMLPGRLGDTPIPLHVWATDLERCEPVEFSTTGTPDVPVADAVMASSSIPLLFPAMTIRSRRRLVDGGLVVNYAHDRFDGPTESDMARPTVGLRFGDASVKEMAVDTVFDEGKALIYTWLKAANEQHLSRKHWAHTITLETAGNWLDFTPDVMALYTAGFRSVCRAYGR